MFFLQIIIFLAYFYLTDDEIDGYINEGLNK